MMHYSPVTGYAGDGVTCSPCRIAASIAGVSFNGTTVTPAMDFTIAGAQTWKAACSALSHASAVREWPHSLARRPPPRAGAFALPAATAGGAACNQQGGVSFAWTASSGGRALALTEANKARETRRAERRG